MQIDFKLAENVKTVNIFVSGWDELLTIEYTFLKISYQIYLVWKISNIDYVFRIPLKIVTAHHSSNYKEHFIQTLTKFRKDYIEWAKIKFPEPWMKNLYNLFNTSIDLS